MNKQTFEFLKLLLFHYKKGATLEEICGLWGISSRTFYNYWNEINVFLESINAQNLFDFDGKKISFNGTSAERNYILRSIASLSLYEYRLSSFERRSLMIALLATNDNPITNSFFCDIFFVSKNTIINDMKVIESELKEFGIEIDENKHNGTCLNANEYQRRRLLFIVLKKIDAVNKYFLESPCDPCIRSLMSFLRVDRYYTKVEQIMRESEQLMLINVTDEDFYQMLLIFSICIERVNGKHLLNQSIVKPSVDDSFIVFAKYVYKNISQENYVDEDEINFYVETIHSFQIISRVVKPHDNPDYVSVLITELLHKFEQYYHVDLVSDKILEEYLTAHVIACYHRIRQRQELSNPYLSEIKENYPKEFELLKNNIYILENGLNIALNDSELAYILMHILATVDRLYAENHIPSVLIVCSCGVATGNYIAAQITKNLNVKVVGNVSVHQVNPILETRHVDLIISTVPYDNPNIPTVVTNAYLSKEDLSAIQSMLSTKKIKPEGNMTNNIEASSDSLSFVKLIKENMIDLNKTATDWKESIIAAGEILLWNKCISVNYLQQMIKLVLQYGPYIVVAPGIALAHAAPTDGVLQPGASIIRLKEPVSFGKEEFDPISIVVACAVNDNLDYSNALLQLMSTIRKPDFYQCVMEAKDAKDVFDYFEKQKTKRTKEQ